jgi:hypothetical protein
MHFALGIESAENLFLLGMSAMLTLDPSCETYRSPYLRAHGVGGTLLAFRASGHVIAP